MMNETMVVFVDVSENSVCMFLRVCECVCSFFCVDVCEFDFGM